MPFSSRSAVSRDDRAMRRHLIASLATIAILAAYPAIADDDFDEARARTASQAGQIRPLPQLLPEVERRYLGQIVEAELEHSGNAWTYEVKLLPPSGARYRVVLDAATGAVIGTKGVVQERR